MAPALGSYELNPLVLKQGVRCLMKFKQIFVVVLCVVLGHGAIAYSQDIVVVEPSPESTVNYDILFSLAKIIAFYYLLMLSLFYLRRIGKGRLMELEIGCGTKSTIVGTGETFSGSTTYKTVSRKYPIAKYDATIPEMGETEFKYCCKHCYESNKMIIRSDQAVFRWRHLFFLAGVAAYILVIILCSLRRGMSSDDLSGLSITIPLVWFVLEARWGGTILFNHDSASAAIGMTHELISRKRLSRE